VISRRLLYLNTHRLTAYVWASGVLTQEAVFEMRDEDHLLFTDYLRVNRNSHFQMLANVGEEGYLVETIPFLRGSDRQTLITRKIGQHFLGTPLASAVSLGFEKSQRKNEKLLLSALTNPAHFAPWLKCIAEADAPLAGIYTIAQLGGVLLQKMRQPATRCMLLTLQDHSIRETYLIKGQPQFSRMAPLPDSSIAGIASAFAAEAAKLLQYLISQRQIGRNDALPVYVLAHPQAATAIRNACHDTGNLIFDILDTHQQARQIGLRTLPEDSRSDLLFLHLLATSPPRQQFASEDHRHDYRISQIRYGLIALGTIALLGGALFAAKEFYETYGLRQETLELTAKESELNWRYREISATFPQIGIDNETLRRLTTRHGELLKQQRLPDAAYRLIGKALDQSPAIQLEALDWRLGEAIGPATSGNRNISVLNGGDEVITVRGIVRLEAGATPRQILATLEQFMQFLRVDRNNEVKVIQQPFDIESSQALRGGDKDDENTQPRQFTLQVARRTAP
jgi:hypothetical protein